MDLSQPPSSRSTAINAALYLAVGIGFIVAGLMQRVHSFVWLGGVWLLGATLLAVRAWRRRDRGSQA